MFMIFAVFVHPLKRISYWKCFHNCVLGSVFIGLPGLQFNFAPVGPINSWEHKGWVESNRLSARIESSLMMSRNDFNLYRVDLYRNDFVSKWPNSKEKNGTFNHWFINFIYLLVLDHWLGTKSQNPPPSHNLKIWNASTNCTSRLFQFVQKGENFGRWGTVVVLLWLKLSQQLKEALRSILLSIIVTKCTLSKSISVYVALSPSVNGATLSLIPGTKILPFTSTNWPRR